MTRAVAAPQPAIVGKGGAVLKPFKRDDEDFMMLGADKRKGTAASGGKGGKSSQRRSAVVHDYETLTAFSTLGITAPVLVSDLDRAIAEVEAKRVRPRPQPPPAPCDELDARAVAGCVARRAAAGRRHGRCRAGCRGCAPACSRCVVAHCSWL